MEASSNALLPLGAVRTVNPKLSRNAFSHSNIFVIVDAEKHLDWGLQLDGRAHEATPRSVSNILICRNCSKLLRVIFSAFLGDHVRVTSGKGLECCRD